jgi:D-psicose/D-tagatose/L-ribulose 3-epimerase
VKLAISNIAWSADEDAAVAEVLRRESVHAVELAPTAWREDALAAPAADVLALRRWWEDRGIAIVALQSLLFGRPDLQLFGGEATRSAMLDHLRRAVDFAALAGARGLVFGSPKNRRRGDVPPSDAFAIAVDFLRAIGAYAHERGTVLCVEANPRSYDCDFVTTTTEAVELCRAADHPGVRVNGDLGGMSVSGENIAQSIALVAPVLGHFHASEPYLAETGSGADHATAAQALRAAGYGEWISVEMRVSGAGQNIAAVSRALRRAKAEYFSGVSVQQR